ncbi:hypothetical protein C7H19_23365 [Aphanothece hegewaldii CCALA 016]|uniref:Uncharacterized protein n=1 Tax=Aphanothece hegewaldii CCALA 016 TaxID=2107694 RepID=A0A2T1LR79_9CHRO|nr:hypothetical protein [Aphanothece hegewaldii]PSF31067.1 hypothetical protein C7H19_23365 [Aphanothece hegewaldii CCALA 016]
MLNLPISNTTKPIEELSLDNANGIYIPDALEPLQVERIIQSSLLALTPHIEGHQIKHYGWYENHPLNSPSPLKLKANPIPIWLECVGGRLNEWMKINQIVLHYCKDLSSTDHKSLLYPLPWDWHFDSRTNYGERIAIIALSPTRIECKRSQTFDWTLNTGEGLILQHKFRYQGLHRILGHHFIVSRQVRISDQN